MSVVRQDGGYGWAVVFGLFITSTCVFGTSKQNGLFFVYLREAFNATNSMTSVIFFPLLSALIFSFLAERYGSRPVVLAGAFVMVAGAVSSFFAKTLGAFTGTYGFLVGLGSAMTLNPSSQMIPRYFDKKIALASALGLTGASFGPLIMPPIMQLAIANYGLSGSLLILACFYLHLFISGTLFRNPDKRASPPPLAHDAPSSDCERQPIKEEDNASANTESCFCCRHVLLRYKACLCNKQLIVFYFSYFTAIFAIINWMMYQQAHAQDRGVDNRFDQAILTTVSGVGEIVSRVLLAVVLHFQIINPHHMNELALVLLAVLFALYPLVNDYAFMLGVSAVVGFLWSAIIVSLLPGIRLVVGIDLVAPAIGLISLPNIIGYASLQLGGLMRDWYGSFDYLYYMCAVICALGAFSIEFITISSGTSVFTRLLKKSAKIETNGPY